MIRFRIPGQPQGKGRARAFVRNGHVGHHTPEKTRSYEGVITTLAMEAMQGMAPSTKPIRINIMCLFEVPKSWPQWKRDAALRGEILPTVKPDLDNVEKAVKAATATTNATFARFSLMLSSAHCSCGQCPAMLY